MKKILAMLLALCMVFALVACGGNNANNTNSGTPDNTNAGTPDNSGADQPVVQDKGTIMWLSNLTDGAQYESTVAYLNAMGDAMGYEINVVFGDSLNDAANNLLAVQNGMTDDTVGIIASQDGGLTAIMEQFPELWVVGYNTDMRSVYAGGENAACLENPKFLGTIADGYSDGAKLGNDTANYVIAQGYKKVSVVNFPAFAYPNLTEADYAFRAAIEAYNATASEPIEIVGETTTLMFAPLEESWFLEGRGDLDAIVGLCAGVQFIYPIMKSAQANGTCAADTVLITSGFETAPDIIADIGEGKTITWLQVSCAENPAYGMILIDKAISGTLPADFANICVDSAPYTIDSVEDIDNVMNKSMMGTGNVADAHLSVEEVVAMANDASLTHAALIEKFHSEQMLVDALKNR